MRESMARDTQLSNISMRLMYEAMVSARLDPRRAFAAARVDHSVIEDPAGKVLIGAEKVVQSAFATLNSDVPNLFADVGTRFTAGLFDVAGLALMTVPTIRRWAEFVRVNDFHFSMAEYSLVPLDSATSALELVVPRRADPLLAQLTLERDVAALLTHLDDLWQSHFPMVRVELALPHVPGRIRSLSHCAVAAGFPTTRLVWTSDVNDRPLPRGNEHAFLHYAARTQARYGPTMNAQLRDRDAERIIELLRLPGNAGLSLDEVAGQLWMAPRTLQRHLAEIGISFRALRDNARCREAKRLLVETDLPVADIARQLGYSEISSMSAAFRRWEKQSPRAFRRDERARSTAERARALRP